MENKTLQAFEEAIKDGGQKKLTVNGMEIYFHYPTIAKACYDIHKAESIKFAEWAEINNYHFDTDKNEWWKQLSKMKTEVVSRKELFDLYQQSKDK